MEASVDHMERLLLNSPDPLSFIVILPDWKEPVPRAVNKIELSRFKRKQLTLNAYEHDLRHGLQHVCDAQETTIKATHPTIVVFLQNDSGFLRWGPTPDRVDALL